MKRVALVFCLFLFGILVMPFIPFLFAYMGTQGEIKIEIK